MSIKSNCFACHKKKAFGKRAQIKEVAIINACFANNIDDSKLMFVIVAVVVGVFKLYKEHFDIQFALSASPLLNE